MDFLDVLDGGRLDGEVAGEEDLEHAQAGHGGQPMLSQHRYPEQGEQYAQNSKAAEISG